MNQDSQAQDLFKYLVQQINPAQKLSEPELSKKLIHPNTGKLGLLPEEFVKAEQEKAKLELVQYDYKTENILKDFSQMYLFEENIRGVIVACTQKSFKILLESRVFCTGRAYGNKLMVVREGDIVFLYNLDNDTIYGPFRAVEKGRYDPHISPFGSRYPYVVKVEPLSWQKSIGNAKRLLQKLGISWRTDILTKAGIEALLSSGRDWSLRVKGNITSCKKLVYEHLIPPLFSTTLWDYPYQSYGDTPKGNNKYPGVTPAFVIYNLIYRYTEPGDIVLDPMAGSGTTIDVCKAEGRRVIAFDIVPTRPDIQQADARNLPLKDESVDMIFVDSPYGDNIRYNEHPNNIGNIPATNERFFDELEKVMKECFRVLKKGKVLAWLIGDQWAKNVFVPVGFKVYERLTRYFEPLDIIAVVRRNQTSNTPFWHKRALEHNFFLRGFKYLIIVRKTIHKQKTSVTIRWHQYER